MTDLLVASSMSSASEASRLITLLIDSDMHFGHGHPRDDKAHNAHQMMTESNVDAILLAGDITNGNAPTFWQWLTCSWTYDACFQTFMSHYYLPLSVNHKVYVIPGNHDREAKYRKSPFAERYCEVDRFCQTTYGSINYTAPLPHGVLLVAIGDMYPTAEAITWFQSLTFSRDTPLILMWHFNILKSEAFGDWWTEAEKDRFWKVIEHCRVLCIITGHNHSTVKGSWHGIPVVRAAGPGYGRVTIDVDQRTIQLRSIKPAPNNPIDATQK